MEKKLAKLKENKEFYQYIISDYFKTLAEKSFKIQKKRNPTKMKDMINKRWGK